jgi:hypothetical protein
VEERGCRWKDCCEPAHLEAVTPGENIRRWHRANNAPTCPKGHPFTPANTYHSKGHGRRCLECVRTDARERMRRKRAAARAG